MDAHGEWSNALLGKGLRFLTETLKAIKPPPEVLLAVFGVRTRKAAPGTVLLGGSHLQRIRGTVLLSLEVYQLRDKADKGLRPWGLGFGV